MSKNGICMSIFIYNSETSLPNIFSKLRSPAVYNPKTNVTANLRRFASPFDRGNSFHAKSSSCYFITYKYCPQCLGSASQPISICREQHLQSFQWTHPYFSWMFVFWQDRSNYIQPPFVKPLHEIADFFIAPVLKDNQPLYSESFLVLFFSSRSISGKQLASFSLSLFNYSLKGYYYYNYVLWPFDQQGYFFRRNVWCSKTHHCHHCYVNPHSADSPTQKKKPFFWKLVFHFYY